MRFGPLEIRWERGKTFEESRRFVAARPPVLGATLIPTYQPVLDSINHPEIAETYEVIEDVERPAGYVWVRPKLHRT